MKKLEIKEKINKVLINFGIININNEPDICLLDYLSDSLQLMEFLCEIEEENLLSYEKFKEIAKEKNVTVNSISSKFKRTLDKIKKHYKGE